VEIPEFLLYMMTIIIIIIGILGSILSSMSFSGDVAIIKGDIKTLNFAQAVLAAPCLVEDVGGETRKGIFTEDKLDALHGQAENKFCIKGVDSFKISVTTDKDKWQIGKAATGTKKVYPVAVKLNGEIVPGKLEVIVP
jgi:hypothetical protein